jgi:hypothetical protein
LKNGHFLGINSDTDPKKYPLENEKTPEMSQQPRFQMVYCAEIGQKCVVSCNNSQRLRRGSSLGSQVFAVRTPLTDKTSIARAGRRLPRRLTRARANSPLVRNRARYLPDSASAPWVEHFIEECAVFPHGVYDDQVDAMTQALLRMRARTWSDGLFSFDINDGLCRPSPWRIS